MFLYLNGFCSNLHNDLVLFHSHTPNAADVGKVDSISHMTRGLRGPGPYLTKGAASINQSSSIHPSQEIHPRHTQSQYQVTSHHITSTNKSTANNPFAGSQQNRVESSHQTPSFPSSSKARDLIYGIRFKTEPNHSVPYPRGSNSRQLAS